MIDIQSRISPINGYKSIYINQFTYEFGEVFVLNNHI